MKTTTPIRHRPHSRRARCKSLRALLGMLLLSAAGYCHGAASANVVSDGGFENMSSGAWTIESGTVNNVGTFWDTAEGYFLLELNGSGPGIIYQDVATQAGKTYIIRFAFAGDPDQQCGPAIKTFDVFWEGTLIDSLEFDSTGTGIFDMGWEYYQVQVTASGSLARLRFESTTSGSCGPALDDVRVIKNEVKLATVNASGGWTFYPFQGGGGSQSGYHSTTSAITTSHLVNPAPQAVYQKLQTEGSLTWAVDGLVPLASYKVRVHLSSIQFSDYNKVRETVWVSNGGSPDSLSNVTPYLSAGFNQGMIVELNHTASSVGFLSGGMTPAGGFYTHAVVSGVEIVKNP